MGSSEVLDGSQESNQAEQKEKNRVMCRAYHWTQELNLDRIINRKDGLIPRSCSYNWYDDRVFGPNTFAFMNSPYPDEWRKFPDVFKRFIQIKGRRHHLALLSFDVYERDNPKVVDFGIQMNGGFFRGGIDDSTHVKYRSSLVPLKEYDGSFTLPELVITKPIPINRISQEELPDFISELLL